MTTLNLTPEELERVLRFDPLPSSQPGVYPFGHEMVDWGDYPTLDDWFHAHRQRFIVEVDRLPRLPHKMNDGPWCEGVYFLFLGDELVYVGQAKYIRQRLNRHGYPPPQRHHVDWFDHYACLWAPRMYLDSVESYYIHRLDPPRNIKLPPAYSPACDYLPK